MGERDVIVPVEVTSDVCEGEPAHLDETEESFGTQSTVILVRIALGQSVTIRQGTGSGVSWNWVSARTQSRAL
jgi:hypothetical protein